MLRGIVFDLDGTLLDSDLDFDAMRREMQLPPGPILEAIERLPPHDACRCRTILHRHELAGADKAIPIAGVLGFLKDVERRGLKSAILTRNSRVVTAAMLRKLPAMFDPVITRDD